MKLYSIMVFTLLILANTGFCAQQANEPITESKTSTSTFTQIYLCAVPESINRQIEIGLKQIESNGILSAKTENDIRNAVLNTGDDSDQKMCGYLIQLVSPATLPVLADILKSSDEDSHLKATHVNSRLN
ncbi:hypothetical protein LLG46_12140 [bacterium]|nr:hypothetical protein [bacterium]